MGQAIKKKTIPGNDDERDIMLIGKIYKSFEALEETLGKLQLEEPLFITYMAKKSFADKHACDERMVAMAKALGRKDADKAEDFVAALVDLQKACGVDDLKMSDYGIDGGNLRRYAQTARETMGGLFALDPAPLDENECVEILRQSYK